MTVEVFKRCCMTLFLERELGPVIMNPPSEKAKKAAKVEEEPPQQNPPNKQRDQEEDQGRIKKVKQQYKMKAVSNKRQIWMNQCQTRVINHHYQWVHPRRSVTRAIRRRTLLQQKSWRFARKNGSWVQHKLYKLSVKIRGSWYWSYLVELLWWCYFTTSTKTSSGNLTRTRSPAFTSADTIEEFNHVREHAHLWLLCHSSAVPDQAVEDMLAFLIPAFVDMKCYLHFHHCNVLRDFI